MPKIMSNGIQLHYEEMGSGPDTIIFSHSYLVNHYHFHYQMEAFKDRYRCIAFDHRGHGQSEIADDGYEMENLYADAVGFMELYKANRHFVESQVENAHIAILNKCDRVDSKKAMVTRSAISAINPEITVLMTQFGAVDQAEYELALSTAQSSPETEH